MNDIAPAPEPILQVKQLVKHFPVRRGVIL